MKAAPPAGAGAAHPHRADRPYRPQGALLGCVVCGAVLIMVALLVLVGGLRAAPPTADDIEKRVLTITDQLRCPTCQALSVKDSEAAFSVQIRDKVRRMVMEGQSDDQIKAYFVSRYGEWILRAPPKEGLGFVVWVLPFAATFAVGVALAWGIVRRSRSRSGSPPPASSLTAAQRERVQRDLRRFEEED